MCQTICSRCPDGTPVNKAGGGLSLLWVCFLVGEIDIKQKTHTNKYELTSCHKHHGKIK